jgi:hypothetical protein
VKEDHPSYEDRAGADDSFHSVSLDLTRPVIRLDDSIGRRQFRGADLPYVPSVAHRVFVFGGLSLVTGYGISVQIWTPAPADTHK